jgi:E3 ubiquitin-protein ligase MARCH6
LIIAPFFTACLYHGWMHRPSSILARLTTSQLIPSDIVSGAIIAAFVIISFLSIMSFADFLRVHWQDPEGGGDGQRRRNFRNENNLEQNNDEVEETDEGQIDNRVMEWFNQHHLRSSWEHEEGEAQHQGGGDANVDTEAAMGTAMYVEGGRIGDPQASRATTLGQGARVVGQDVAVHRQPLWGEDENVDDEDDSDSDYVPEDESSDEEELEEDEMNHVEQPAHLPPPAPGNGGPDANQPFDPLDPIFQDDQAVRNMQC